MSATPKKKPIADSTRKEYEHRLRRIESLAFKIDPNNITEDQIKLLFERFHNQQTVKGFLSALLWYVREKKGSPESLATVQKAFDEQKQKCKEIADRQELTPNQLANYMTRTELVTLYNNATGKMNFDETTYNDNWIYYTLVVLYVCQPPVRADYWNMKIHRILYHIPDIQTFKFPGTNFPLSKYPESETLAKDWIDNNHLDEISYRPFSENYCIVANNKSWFVFKDYKTAKSYGTVYVEAEWIVHHLLVHLVTAFKVDKLLPIDNPNNLVKYVKKAFAYFGGKEITIGLLRHSYIVDFYKNNPSLLQKQALASKMLHSVSIQEHYRSENVIDDEV